MKIIEKFLNFIIWAIHDIGRAIKHNPLTEAWWKMQEQKIERNSLTHQEIKDMREVWEMQEKMNDPSIGEMIYKSSKSEAVHRSKFPEKKQLSGFKEYVRREEKIKLLKEQCFSSEEISQLTAALTFGAFL